MSEFVVFFIVESLTCTAEGKLTPQIDFGLSSGHSSSHNVPGKKYEFK